MTPTKRFENGINFIENYYPFLNKNSYIFSENGTFEKLIPEMNGNWKTQCYKSLLDFCHDTAKKLPQRESFYILDLADILLKIQVWREMLPDVEIYYAVKVFTDSLLLQLLCMMGLSFDCASEGEIREVLRAGGSPKNIIFAHTIKTEDELCYAAKVGADFMTFDNVEELLKIHRVFPEARLLIRLSPAMVKCTFDLSDKFGCSLEEANRLLSLAKQLRMNVIGVCFHVGALCKDPNSYSSTIRDCRTLFDEAEEMGFEFSVLDIGGGFSGHKGSEDLFDEITSAIRQALDTYFSDKNIRVIAEPGCYVAVSAVQLICTVIGKKHPVNENERKESERKYFVNNGIYGSFFRDIESYDIKIKPLSKELDPEKPKYNSKIFGQTCCSEDVISSSILLPELKAGELLLWENMGAYSRGLCSTFCGMPLPEIKYIFQQNNRLHMNWVRANKDVSNFIKKHATFIGLPEDYI